MDINQCTAKNTKLMEEFIPLGEMNAKVLSVYDGDTIWIAYMNPFLGQPIRAKARFTRINAPEIRGKSTESAADKRERLIAANRSRDMVCYIIQHTTNDIIRINVIEIEKKFGRMLCDILIPEADWARTGLRGDIETRPSGRYVDLSTFMLKGGYAIQY
jgi:endonuclease YncB( thermonuclease family)